jgi:hypothetical protein
MFVAKKYLEGIKAPSCWKEWLAFISLFVISMIGASPEINKFVFPPAFNTIWVCVVR